MDELLHERVTQLKEIDDRLERIERKQTHWLNGVKDLRADLSKWIERAETEYAEF